MSTMSIIPMSAISSIEEQTEANKKLMRELIVNGNKLNDQQLQGRAAFAAIYGLDPVSEVNTIIDQNGKTMSHSVHITGYRRLCDQQVDRERPGAKVELDFIKIPQEELPPEAFIGYECWLRDGSSRYQWSQEVTKTGAVLRDILGPSLSYRDLIDAVGPSPIYKGIGIVYKQELNIFKDRNYNPMDRAMKRAEKNARSRRFTINAPVYDGEGGPMVRDNSIDGEFSDVGPSSDERPTAKYRKSEQMLNYELGYGDGTYSRADYERDLAAASKKEDPADVSIPSDVNLDQGEPSAEEQPGEGLIYEDVDPRIELQANWPDGAKVSFEMAETITAKNPETGEKVAYMDLGAEKLDSLIANIEANLKNPKITEKSREDMSFRLDVARIIRSLK